MNEQLRKILRAGLIKNHSQREPYLNALQDIDPSKEKLYVEWALRDPQTTLDDQDAVESGEHAKTVQEAKYEVLNEDTMTSMMPGTDLKTNLKGFNEYLDEFDDPNDINAIKIRDSFHEYEDLFLDVDGADLLEYVKKGEYFLDDEAIREGSSNNRVMSALKIFDTRLSATDKEDIMKSLNVVVDKEAAKKKKYVSKKAFINATNNKLSDEERMKFAGLLLKKSKDIFNSHS